MVVKSVTEKDAQFAAPIRFVLSDVDGVMTDGRITIDNAGVETKSFYVRDGIAIKMWQRQGLGFGVLTARSSQIVKLRSAELGISVVRQGIAQKLPAAVEICKQAGITLQELCYIGDDLPDVPVIRNAGLGVTVADGAAEAREAADWVTQAKGGAGAIRELIERLMKAKGCWESVLSAQFS